MRRFPLVVAAAAIGAALAASSWTRRASRSDHAGSPAHEGSDRPAELPQASRPCASAAADGFAAAADGDPALPIDPNADASRGPTRRLRLHRAPEIAGTPLKVTLLDAGSPDDGLEATKESGSCDAPLFDATAQEDEIPLPRASSGRLAVLVRGPGAATCFQIVDEDPPAPDPIVLAIEPAAPLHGRILDVLDGSGIAGAHVRRRCESLEELATSLWKVARLADEEAVTDEGGRFRFVASSWSPQRLTFSHPGFLANDAHAVRPGRDEILLELTPAASVVGRVLDGNGSPIAEAELVAGLIGRLPISERSIGRTLADGTFHSDSAPATEIALTAMHDGFAPTRLVLDLARGAIEPVTLVLAPEAPFAGRVVDDAGAAVAGASVVVGCLTDHLVAGSLETEEDGSFSMPWIAAGRAYHVQIDADGHDRVDLGPFVAPQRELALVLPRRGVLRGRVVDARGSPIRRFTLTCVPATSNPWHEAFYWSEARPADFSDPLGRFELARLHRCQNEVVVSADGFAPRALVATPGSPGERSEERTVTLESSRPLSGRIERAHGEPVSGARVSLARHAVDGALVAAVDAPGVVTNERGEFTIRDAPVAPVDLAVDVERDAPIFFEQVARSGAALVLRLPATGRIIGRVDSPYPSPQTTLYVRLECSRARSALQTRPDRDGRFLFERVPVGPARLAVVDEWSSTLLQAIVESEQWIDVPRDADVDARLPAPCGAVLAGVLASSSSFPDARWTVEAIATPSCATPSMRFRSSVESGGRFAIAGIDTGSWRVRATTGSRGLLGWSEREVAFDATRPPAELELDAPEPALLVQLVDASTGEPLEEGWIDAAPEPGSSRGSQTATLAWLEPPASDGVRALVDRDGRILIGAACDSEPAWFAGAPGRERRRLSSLADLRRDPRIALSAEARLHVCLRDSSDHEVEDAKLSIEALDLRGAPAMLAEIGACVELCGLPAGALRLQATRASTGAQAIWTGVVGAGESRELTLTLAGDAEIVAEVLDGAARPQAGMRVLVAAASDADDRQADPATARIATTASDGRARCRVAPGRYVVGVDGRSEVVVAAADAIATVTLRLP